MSEIKKLLSLHRRTQELTKEYLALNREYFNKLSKFKTLDDYLRKTKKLNSNEERSQFLCILAKDKFLTGEGVPFSLSIEIKEAGESNTWTTILQFDPSKKEIEISASYSYWNSSKIMYHFNCFSIFSGSLFEEENMRQGSFEHWHYIDSFRDPDYYNYGRRDFFMSNVINLMFKSLKKQATKK